MMSSVDNDFCDNETSPDRTVPMELEYNKNDEEKSNLLLLPHCNQSIECTSNKDISYIGLLKHHREYRWYLLSSLVTDAGEWFSYIASIAAIEQIHTINDEAISRTSVSILFALRLLPSILFSNIGGVFADSYDRRNILFVLDVLGSFTAFFFLLAYQLKSIAVLYVAAFCQMTVAAMYEPARNSLVPMFFTNEGYLKKALTLTGLTWSVMASVGASTGGLVTEYAGINACFLIDSATYLLSACFIWMIRGRYVATATDEASEDGIASTITVAKDDLSDNATQWISLTEATKMMTDGFAYLRSKSWGALVFLKFCACLVYGSADVLNVAFSEKRYTNGDSNDADLDGSSGRLGILFASVGVGCFVGPVVIEKKFCSNDMLGRVMAVDYALSTLSEAVAVIAGGLLLDIAGLSPYHVSFIMAILALATMIMWTVYFYRVRV
eukprot:scaffold14690_cov71-Cyclotella_meneghiniana.AAC.8